MIFVKVRPNNGLCTSESPERTRRELSVVLERHRRATDSDFVNQTTLMEVMQDENSKVIIRDVSSCLAVNE